MILRSIITAIVIFSFLSCDSSKKTTASNSNGASDFNKECPEERMCTMDYRLITVNVKNEKKERVSLDSISVYLTEQPSVILISENAKDNQETLNYGAIRIAEDRHMHQVRKDGSKVTLLAFSKGQQVIKESYVIGHDCCHITLISGNRDIIVH